MIHRCAIRLALQHVSFFETGSHSAIICLSTAKEVRGRGSCPEAQCPGGVRGVSFRRCDPAWRIL